MRRRTFLQAGAAGISLGTAAANSIAAPQANAVGTDQSATGKTARHSFALDGNRVRFYSADVQKPTSVLVVADTHLFTDDERGEPYRRYSQRMAAAYNTTQHFQTGDATTPTKSFEQVLQRAQEQNVDMLALVGDIFSFPSEAAIDWVGEKLEGSKQRYFYVAGNHDWHYEGMPGSLEELRSTWIDRRLKPLYQGRHPLMSFHDVGDVRILAIDNSHYQILPEQLAFFRQQVKTGKPLLLTVHIPLFAPGRPMGFGCGHPEWGAKSDRNFELEQRPRWPAAGHTQATLDFHREVFSTPNLLGIFAGHTHRNSVDVIHGIPQFVTDDNASGGYMDVELLPA